MAKIMLVEDDNNLREIYGARLLAEGHEIVTAKDGEEALAVAVKEKPELIISDVMMPKISGFDMLDILRNAPETKFTKVIMMTALSQTEDKARADSLGADRYLVKSQVTLEDVARVVKDVLEGKTEADTRPEVSVEATTESPNEAPETSGEILAPSTNSETTEPEVPAPAVETPAPEPVPAPTTETAPEIMPVSEPVTTPDPVTSTDPTVATDTSAPTQISVTALDPAPANDTVATTTPVDDASATPTDAVSEVTAPQINVELPQMPSTTPTEPSAEPEKTPEAETQPEEPASPIGPNLMEALQQESDKPAEEPNATEPINTSPTVVNGAENTIVEPTATPDEQTSEIPATETQEEPAKESVVKKGIIQPLNDINTGPNLNALLDAEEKKAPVQNPPANSVISPVGTAPEVPGGVPAPSSEHDIISL